MNAYSNSRVYLLHVGDDTYVGSTARSMARRMQMHMYACARGRQYRLYEVAARVGWDNVRVEILEECSCKDKEELRWRERQYYDALRPTLNTYKPIVSAAERHRYKMASKRQRYTTNREHILALQRAAYARRAAAASNA